MIPGLKAIRKRWNEIVRIPKAIRKAFKEKDDIKPAYRQAFNAWDNAMEDGKLDRDELERALEKTKVFILENFQFAEILWKLVKPIARRIL